MTEDGDTIKGAGLHISLEDIEKFSKENISDRIGELVDVRLKKIENFHLIENEDGKCIMMPYNKVFNNKENLINYMNQYHIGGDGHVTYRSRYLREATDTYIAISTRSGGDIGAIKIELDAIDLIMFIGNSVIVHNN